jgi:peptide/nickel transport system permease protein
MDTTQISSTLPGGLVRRRKIAIWGKSSSLNAGIILVGIVLLFACFPGVITSLSPTDQDAEALLKAPSLAHLFGTDNFGRDIFARVVYGTRIDLIIGILAMIVPFVTGSLIGLVAGYYGKWVDSLLMRILDVFMAFPFIVLVIAIVAILGPGLNNLYIAIWLVGWKDYARLVRSEVMVAKNAEYVQAAKVLGFTDMRILLRHILPNVLSVSIVFAAADVVMCMLSGASLSFLGLGVQPPTPEWGAIISEGRAYLAQAWWICAFPGLALVVAGTGFSLLGDGLSDLLRTKGR